MSPNSHLSRLQRATMEHGRRATLVCCLSIGLVSAGTAAASGYRLQYSGRLTSAQGAPLGDSAQVALKFWDSLSGGTQRYTDIDLGTLPLNQGIFTAPFELSGEAVQAVFGDGSAAVYAEISANGATYPRQIFSFVPYALRTPVDERVLQYGSDGKLGLAPAGTSGPNKFLTLDGTGKLKLDSPVFPETATSLQGRQLSTTAPSAGQVLTYAGGVWTPTTLPTAATALDSLTVTTPLAKTTSGGVTTLSLPQASSVSTGYLGQSDWLEFKNKLGLAGGTLSGPLALAGNNLDGVGNISMVSDATLMLGTRSQDPTGLSTVDRGKVWFDSATNSIRFFNGAETKTLGTAGAVYSLNGVSGESQTFSTGSAGTSPTIVSANGAHTFNIPLAASTGVIAGLLSNTDFQTFNTKVGQVDAGAGIAVATSGTTKTVSLASVSAGGTYSRVATDQYGRVTSGSTLTVADIPELPATIITSGTLSVARGGTGIGSVPTDGQMLIGGSGGYRLGTLNPGNSASIVITNGSGSISLDTAQDIRLTASPQFAGLTLSSTPGSVLKTSANGTIQSASATDVIAVLGYTPMNRAGDTVAGTVSFTGNDLLNTGNILMAASKTLALSAHTSDPAGLTAGDKGKTWFNTTTNQIKYWDGSTAIALGAAGSGLSSLNGQVGNTQTFGTPGTTGTAPAWASASNVHTLSIPLAATAGVTAGLLSNADYTAFNGKLGAVAAGTGIGVATASGTATVTLATTGTAGTYTKVTTDAYGRVTAATSLSAGDLPPHSAALITSGTLAVANGGTGATSLAANNVILGNGTSPVQVVAPGASGNVLTSNGTTWQSTAMPASVTSVTGTAPISVASGTSTPVISIAQASGTTSGFLSAADWVSFNTKQAAGNYITALTGDVTATGAGSAAASLANVALPGTSTKVTYDAKGRVTTGTTLSTADLPPLSAALITAGTLTVANGGTGANLTSTGGTGQYLKQVTAGGAVTVGTMASSDITTALGYTPLRKTGDTMSGALNMGSFDLTSAGNILMAASKTLALSAHTSDPAGLTAGDKGKTWFNTTTNQIKYWDGSTAIALGAAGSGLSSLNGQGGNTQTFATPNTTGTAPTWSSASNVHTLSIPLAAASGVTAGLLSNADYVAFNGKLEAVASGTGISVATASGTATVTLATTGTAGTYTKVTTDTYGRVTAATSLSAGDLPPHSAALITSGTLAVANGGTGATSLAANNVILGNGTSPVQVVAPGASGNVLTSNGTTWSSSPAPSVSWAAPGAIGATTPNTGAFTSLTSNSQSGFEAKPFGTTTGNTGEIRFTELAANGANHVGFKAPDAIAANKIWVLPTADGSSGQVLKTDGSGNLGWVSAATGSVTSVGITAPASGISVAGGPITASGNLTLALNNDLAAVEGLSTTGGVERTGADTWATYTLTAAGKALLDDADATAQRATLGLTALATASAVSGGVGGTITDSSIVNADIAADAAVATSKLSGAVTSISGHGLGSLATASAVSGGTGGTITDGSITNADISATAGIVDSKLATISTAGKVSGAAINSGTIGGSTAISTSGLITTTGNIGIGTTAPTTKLQIVGGQAASGFATNTTRTINWNSGNIQTTSVAAGTLTMSNMVDGAGYTLVINNATGGNYTLAGTGLTFKCNPSCPIVVTAGADTVIGMVKGGSTVWVAWNKGFQ